MGLFAHLNLPSSPCLLSFSITFLLAAHDIRTSFVICTYYILMYHYNIIGKPSKHLEPYLHYHVHAYQVLWTRKSLTLTKTNHFLSFMSFIPHWWRLRSREREYRERHYHYISYLLHVSRKGKSIFKGVFFFYSLVSLRIFGSGWRNLGID